MKKFLLLISLFIFSIIPVYADTVIVNSKYSQSYYSNLDISTNYNLLIDYFNDQDTYDYYIMSLYNGNLTLALLNDTSTVLFSPVVVSGSDSCSNIATSCTYISIIPTDGEVYTVSNGTVIPIYTGINFDLLAYNVNVNPPVFSSFDYSYYDSNFDITINYSNITVNPSTSYGGSFPYNSIHIDNLYNDTIILDDNITLPKLHDLLRYSSWNDYEINFLPNYTTVNLDDYEYVLLTLKNYNQFNAFQTNLQVRGQIGITPIYNFGQTSKDSVTGIQVQDRCNVTYNDYTTYPFYILQSDLQNNVVYAVKSCSPNSSFKFDNLVFDIFYVTQSNLDNPTVTINGNSYNVIPYADLPSTATKNEEDNYIPGESYNFIDAGVDSLNSALKGAGNWLSNTWSTFTYFTSFVGLIFSSLPSELHAILISAFAITIMIGLIKHFTG